MTEVRNQLNIGEDEHNRLLAELSRSGVAIAARSASDPGQLRVTNYKLALEQLAMRCLESGRPLRDELKTRQNDREVGKLRGIFDISDSEHEEALSELLDRSNLVLREARGWLEEIAETHFRITALSGPGGWSRVGGLDLLVHHLESRRREIGAHLSHLLSAGGDGADTLARWCNLALSGRAWDLLKLADAEGAESSSPALPERVIEILREDVVRSAKLLEAGDTPEFADLRALLASRPQPREFLGTMALGPEPAAAAIALHVFAQLDPEPARAAAEAVLATADRHWLIEEVARTVRSVGRGGAPGSDRLVQVTVPDYDVASTGTPDKMIHLFQSEFFRHLDIDVLASIARGADVRVYRRGGVVCRVGEPSDRVFVICDGGADVHIERDGRPVWANAVSEGDSIGELGVFTGQPRSATVVASRDATTLISIDGASLIAVLNRNARAAMSFLTLLSTRQQGMLAQMSGR
jgi:hypothetical protein